ncbi:MAG TPA: hypothetical protein H9741_01360 [Candidatus Borkfalkia faecipullorum]|uniref:Uncharacterized protein n=1 Tax=Candidatus Borkfalkia faecipullorum TaxID=2838510 RepID=A0A9D1V6I5_9FIRM|nr:hypothetical protein [Candidatus Borkfalkia faecipullorum]
MKKRRNRSVAVGLIALFVSVAMFAVTILARYAFQNTEQYSVGWIKYFTYFPNSLVALIPIGLLVIAFFVMLYEASCTISYLRADPSHKSVQEMLEIIDYDFKQKRAFLYGAIVIAALYAVMQVITFIWGPGFRVSISPEESEGKKQYHMIKGGSALWTQWKLLRRHYRRICQRKNGSGNQQQLFRRRSRSKDERGIWVHYKLFRQVGRNSRLCKQLCHFRLCHRLQPHHKRQKNEKTSGHRKHCCAKEQGF